MPGKILGLDIADNEIAAVQVVSTLKGYQVTACATAGIEGEGGLDNALKLLFDNTDLKSDICHTSISSEHASFRNLILPFKDTKKIKQTIPFEIEAMVPVPIEDMIVDFSIISRSESTEILAASVNKAVISEHLDRLRSHGLDPDIVDIRCAPLAAWLLRQKDTGENGILLNIDGTKGTIVLFHQRRIVLIRRFSNNGGYTSPAVSDSSDGNDSILQIPPGDVVPYYQSLGRIIQNTLHGFCVHQSKEILPEKIYIAGNGLYIKEASELLGRLMGIAVEQLDFGRDERLFFDKDISGAFRPDLMANALALAVRDARQDMGFNFRKDEFEKKRHYFGTKKEIKTASIFLIVLLCFLATDFGVDYYFVKKRCEALDQQIEAVFKETFPDVKRIVDPAKQMKVEINKLKESSVSGPSITANTTVLAMLKDISEKIPDSLDVHIARMVLDADALRISGTTDTFNTVDKIKNSLSSSDCFSAVTISSAKLDRTGNKVEFEVKLERGANK
ncbi:putative general secretion pathway protein L [uncultured Desulfobacterium sp.]|uniref:Putative general secretion pathway protein L n=1 Tax=uncultured Desulfobacterium sp. TaxID=201089 RepID=A0A445MSQ4_9BACT|nr:putative general secretion pathway protein L [uncultured Desulfobacterium sp.]